MVYAARTGRVFAAAISFLVLTALLGSSVWGQGSPTIESVTPTDAQNPGEVVVTGTGFEPSSEVFFEGQPA